MHEVGLVEGIVETVQARAGDRPVARVKVRIGVLHRAGDGPMEQAFEMVTAGTALEGATLELVQMPVTSTCTRCGRAQSAADMVLVCPDCGATAMDFAGGDELLLESIEYRGVAAGVRLPG
jgi:hydrogenase nickel incorporation protein HypA/HybF